MRSGSCAAPQPRGRFLWQSLARDRDGVVMVEFAIAALPFFFLVFAIIEIGFIFVANISLANATLSLTRQIRVGKLMAAGKALTTSSGAQLNVADFKAAVCKAILLVPTSSCLSQLQIDVRTQTSFQAQVTPTTGSGTNFDATKLCFYSGSAGDVVIMRAYYLWPIQTSMVFNALAGTTSVTTSSRSSTGNFFVLTSSEIFRNEPTNAAANNGSGC